MAQRQTLYTMQPPSFVEISDPVPMTFLTSTTYPDADDPSSLMQLFNALFLPTFNTELVRGGDEPLYRPASGDCSTHRIIFARGYFSSALHEISHWCIAGYERRQLEDYGYWYIPDGRNVDQQHAFEQVEVKPQAVECLLAEACGRIFHVSVDNLEGDVEVDRKGFTHKVKTQAEQYQTHGLPPRAEVLYHAFNDFYINGLSVSDVADKQRPIITALR